MHPPEEPPTSPSRFVGDETGFLDLLEEARRCRKAKDLEGARKAYASLLVQARVAGRDHFTAQALHGLGAVLLRRMEYQAARAVLSEAVAVWERLGDARRAASSGTLLGVALQHASDYGGAFVHLRHALERFRAVGDPMGVARCTSWLGVIAARLSDYEAAMRFHLETLRIGEDLADIRVRGTALNSLGLVHWKLHDLDEAERCFQRALDFRREVGDTEGEADTLSNLGMLCDERGDHESALAFYFQSLEVRTESDRDPNRATTLQNIGNTYSARGELEHALDYHEQALAIRERLGGAPLASSYKNLGALFLKLDRLDDAGRNLERAHGLATECELRDEERQILGLLAEHSERSGDLRTALDLERRARELERKIFRADGAQRIADMRARYEAEQKDKEAEIFRLRNVELVEVNRRLQDALASARDLARRDPLTGLSNRRELLEHIQAEIDRFNRYGHPFSLVLFDLDRFKRVNDEHGHDVGDAMLVAFADILRDQTRIEDQVGRWGGEEFLVLLPETDGEGAEVFAERLRAYLEGHVFECLGVEVRGTLSAGTSTYRKGDTISACLKRADAALYEGKDQGRNRVVRSPDA